MLTTELDSLVYNHIQHGIYLRIELYPNFDRQGEYQPADKMGFTFKDTRNIQSIFLSHSFNHKFVLLYINFLPLVQLITESTTQNGIEPDNLPFGYS